MKICWDNLEKVEYLPHIGQFRTKIRKNYYIYVPACEVCGNPYLAAKKQNHSRYCSRSCAFSGERNPSFGTERKLPKRTEEHRTKLRRSWTKEKREFLSKRMKLNNPMKDPKTIKKVSIKNTGEGNYFFGKKRPEHSEKMKGANNAAWNNGAASYNIFGHRLSLTDKVRRHPEELDTLQTACAYCGKWFTPKALAVYNRNAAINKCGGGENRLYCSEGCKKACPIFKRRNWPKGHKPATSREVQPELRQMVLERDNWTCQYGDCGATVETTEIHCHHITGVEQNPIESADVDNCITFCKKHHKKVHREEGCKYHQLRKKKCNPDTEK